MHRQTDTSRRQFLKGTGLGLLAAASLPGWVQAMQMAASPKIPPRTATPGFRPDVELELIARKGRVPILSGADTEVMQYVARSIGKDSGSGVLTPLPGSYLGPLIRLQRGQKVRIHFKNELPDSSITHWHGLHVPAEVDGHPRYAIGQGETFVYEFEVNNRASLNIYHPHPHENTARQVYMGLAGGLIINDEEENRLGLPSGEYEIPIVLQDRAFDENNQLIYLRHRMDRMTGFYGDRVLVNGRVEADFEVATRAYRLRIMNGSTARIYKLGWDDGTPLTVLGVDGGLLEKPATYPYVMLAPGERLDVWADFSGRPTGSEPTLRSLPYTGVLPAMMSRMMGGGGMGGHDMGGMMGGGMGGGGMGGMMGGGMMGHNMGGGMGGHDMGGMMGGGGMGMAHASKLPVGSDYPLVRFKVTRKTSDSPSLPTHLSKLPHYSMKDVANPDKPIPVGISEGPMSMLLNGRPYASDDLLPLERVRLNSIQLMEIFHAHEGMGEQGMKAESHGGEQAEHRMEGMSGGGMGGMGGMGMMMSMAHPIHFHGQSFQILSRTIDADDSTAYDTVREGFINEGLKDTVLVMPGERVRLIKPFEDYPGLFMYHCHNLEHEDMGMMREFLVE